MWVGDIRGALTPTEPDQLALARDWLSHLGAREGHRMTPSRLEALLRTPAVCTFDTPSELEVFDYPDFHSVPVWSPTVKDNRSLRVPYRVMTQESVARALVFPAHDVTPHLLP